MNPIENRSDSPTTAVNMVNPEKKVVTFVFNRQFILSCLVGLFLLQSCSNLPKIDISTQPEVVIKPEVIEPIETPIEVPDFSAFTDVNLKKKTFFNFIYDFVETVNMEVKTRRIKIVAIAQKSEAALTPEERLFIDNMSSLYLNDHDSTDTLATAKILTAHVDIVPPSLALAQAANESGWGTSRFATDANNYFGQWCFSNGCGLVPEQRSADSNFEVRKFKTVEDSVRSYIRNINTHRAYTELREIRENIRQKGNVPDGENLSEGLGRYSERGEHYINELQSMIRFNELETYDEIFQTMQKVNTSDEN